MQVSDKVLTASIPSPSISQLTLGPLTIHIYALCILAGIMACLWLTGRRWKAMGENPDRVLDVAFWAIPFGIVGARLYHVLITDPSTYFGEGADPLDALKIWEGGIGIMGAISVGALGAWIACRRYGMSFVKFADAAAPGILLAQAIGRWGNWFNQELFGKPTTLPWGLEIDPNSYNFPAGYEAGTLFHPTFLYESLWNLAGVAVLLWLTRSGLMKLGQTFWAYVLWYAVGRFLIELFLRIDTPRLILGLRVHVWTSGTLILLAIIGLVVAALVAKKRADARASETDVAAVKA